jgi:hypothetical protein
MVDFQIPQGDELKVALHGEHLGYALGDGHAGGEDQADARDSLDVWDFEEQVEGTMRPCQRGSEDRRIAGQSFEYST